MSDVWSPSARKPRPRALVSAAYQLLMADKAMVGVLALGALASVVAMSAILMPAWFMGLVHPWRQDDGLVGYLIYAAALWASSFVTVLTSGAIVAAAMMRADGHDPTVGQALAAAWARRGPLAAWATVSTVVGLISRALNRFGVEGLIVRALAGLAWVVATTFAIPVIIAEGTMPIETVRRSSSIVMHTFGRTIRSEFRLGLIWAVAIVASMLVAAFGAVAIGLGINDADPIEVAIGGLIGVVGVVAFFFAWITSSALQAYLSAVLFRYATGRPLPGIDPAYLPPLPQHG